MLDLHHESENVAAQTAPEAHEDLLFFAYVEGGSLLVVEGAPGNVIFAALFQRHIFGYEGDDIDGISYFIQNAVRVKWHGKQPLPFQTIKTSQKFYESWNLRALELTAANNTSKTQRRKVSMNRDQELFFRRFMRLAT